MRRVLCASRIYLTLALLYSTGKAVMTPANQVRHHHDTPFLSIPLSPNKDETRRE